MRFDDPRHVNNCEFHEEDSVNRYFKWVADNGNVDFVLSVMERKDTHLYSCIKRVSERKYGILTQCLTMKSVQKANHQLYGMILMKINAKLGGVACKIDWSLVSSTRKSVIICFYFQNCWTTVTPFSFKVLGHQLYTGGDL